MEDSEINDIIALDYYCSKNTHKLKKKLNINNIPINIQNYVNNRYTDSLSLKETLYRMFYHLDIHPKCPICGKPVIFGTCGKSLHWHKTCNNSKCKYEIYKQTMYNNFGYINIFQNDNVKNKIKNTLKLKYGVEHPLQNKSIKEKQEKTCLTKFGSNNFYSSEYGKNKIKKILINKYGVDHPMKSEQIKNKFNWNKIIQKQLQTKKENNSFNISNEEDESFLLLKKKYVNIKRQYKSNVYPFNCDFYIPDLDLYIECNYHWTHGFHLYNPNNINDQNKLKLWKSKNSKYYNNAIKTWTKLDILKYTIAKNNNLNYLIFYNINDLKKWININ